MTNTAPDRRLRRGQRTRKALLRAARAPFARDGFAKASVRRIARSAGAHPALLTYHFGSKRALYREVIREALASLRERLLAEVALSSSAGDAARRALHAYLGHLSEDPAFPQLVLRAVLDGDREVLAILQESLGPLFEAAPALVGGRPAPEEVRDAMVSFFGAAVAPYLYAPLLARLNGEDPTAARPTARRLAHLERLAALYLDDLAKENS